MIDSFYSLSFITVLVISLFTAVAYTLGCLFGERKYLEKNYLIARHWMSFAMLFATIINVLHISPIFSNCSYYVLGAVSLLFYYVVNRFIGIAMVHLSNPSFLKARHYYWLMIKLTLFTLFWVFVFLFAPERFYPIAMLIAMVIYVFDSCIMSYYLIKFYLDLKREVSNYYSVNYEGYFNWMPLVTGLIIFCCIASTFVPVLPLNVLAVFNFITAGISFYIFICYERYLVFAHYRSIMMQGSEETFTKKESAEQLAFDKPVVESQLADYLETELQKWVATKGYRRQDINIMDLARCIGTNRTYLSNYINSHYKASFRQWIASLRLNDAKHLLVETNMSFLEIAELVGFTYLPTFTRSFIQSFGCSPNDFRKQNKKMEI